MGYEYVYVEAGGVSREGRLVNEPSHIFNRLNPQDPAQIKAAQLQVLDMVRAKIEEGQVASLLFVMVAADPARSGEKAYTGSRFIVESVHLDLVEDGFREAMAALEKQYGVTVKELRASRARGPKA